MDNPNDPEPERREEQLPQIHILRLINRMHVDRRIRQQLRHRYDPGRALERHRMDDTDDPKPNLQGTSCTSSSACTSIGAYANSQGITINLAEAY